jgi:hypothetical protein
MLHLPASLMRRRISERVPEFDPKPLTLPFVGRDEEMLKLHERFELARNGESQCVVLAGDAGIGKTRLAEEFCTKAVLSGARVERVVVQPHDRMRPLGALADLVPRLVELPGALGCSPESLSLLQRLTTHNPTASATTSVPDAMSSEVLQSAISRALADLIDSITSESTLVVFVDDSQWSDDISRQTIAALASARHHRRLMLMLTSRDKTISRFFAPRTERLVVVSLRPLAAPSVSLIVARLLDAGALSSDAELRDWIVETSGGNPFFLRCLIAHFQTSGERFTIPATLNNVLDQQLAGLSDTSMSILRTCVALGRHSDIEHLEKALEVPFLELQIAIAELESAHLLAHIDGRIEPAHRLVSDTVDRSLSPISRKLLHRRLATILEGEAQGPHAAARLWECAEHWVFAEEHGRAATMMRECANHSLDIGRPREAAEVLLRAATMIAGKDRLDLATSAVQMAAEASEHDLVLRGVDFARSIGGRIEYDGFELAEVIARIVARDESARAWHTLKPWIQSNKPLDLRLRAGMHLLAFADMDDQLLLGQETFATLSNQVTLPEARTNIHSLFVLLIYHSRFGDIAESVRLARHLLTVSESAERSLALDIRRKCATALFRGGFVRDSIEVLQGVYEDATKDGRVRLANDMSGSLCGLHLDCGDDAQAAEWLSRTNESMHQIYDNRSWLMPAFINAHHACVHNRPTKAREWLASVDEGLGRSVMRRSHRWAEALRTWVRQLEGDRLNAADVVRNLTGFHLAKHESGEVSDVEIAVAATALFNEGKEKAAQSLVARYFDEFRRTRVAARSLQQAIHRIGWEAAAIPASH